MVEGDERTADECDGVHVKDYCKECGCPKDICCRREGAIAQKKKDEIDFIRIEILPKNKKKLYRVFFKDGTEQVFPI